MNAPTTPAVPQSCSKRVYDARGFHAHQCCKKPVIEVDGKWFCKIHDPAYVEAKKDARYASWDAVAKVEFKRLRLENASVASYTRHCGERAVELAEGDLLGEALELLEKIRVEFASGARMRGSIHVETHAILAKAGRVQP